jgi:2-hydroxychromene-2-carboxylate isomerase
MQLPKALEGLSYHVTYTPILFAGLLKNHGQLGPAEIAPKREWTYRQVMWQAKALGIDCQMPASHPFNPLGLLRLATACGEVSAFGATHTNRFVTQQLFDHVWKPAEGGKSQDAADPARLAVLTEQLAHKIKAGAEPASDVAKARLKANTDAALQAECFGVPTLCALRAGAAAGTEKNFWGLDALPMLREYLEGSDWFDSEGGWDRAAKVGTGIRRL